MYKQNFLNMYFNDDGNVVIVAGSPDGGDHNHLELNHIIVQPDQLHELLAGIRTIQDEVENMECI